MLKYLKGTRELKTTLSVGDMSVVKWWVDNSYAVREDYQGQTGAMISLGKVAVSRFFIKQKINLKSSTKGDMIGVDGAMEKILWSRYFIEVQGYHTFSLNSTQ